MLSLSLLTKVVPKRFRKFIETGGEYKGPGSVVENLTCQDLIWQTKDLNQMDFMSSVITAVYSQNVSETVYVPEHLRPFMHLHKIPLITCCFAGCIETIAIDGDISDIVVIKRFLRAFRDTLLDTLETPARDNLLTDIADFYATLLASASFHGQDLFKNLVKELHPFPPHLPKRVRQQLVFLSLYPNFRQIHFHLQSITIPRLYLLDHQMKKRLNADELFEILLRLPQTVPITGFIQDFERRVWKAHVFYNKEVAIDINITGREILAQIICFMLPNWFQLWPELFDNTFEIQRRLWELKKNKWTPPVEEYIRIFL
jgi:hypothetical protein